MEITSFQPSNLNAVGALILDIQNNEFGIPITLAEQPDLLDIPNFYQVGTGNFWIASENDQVVGSVGLLDIGDRQIALRKMFVHQNFRGKGFGVAQALLDTACRWATENHSKTIFLGTTDKFIAAHRFYEKNGFVKINISNLPERFPVMKVDTIFY